MILIPRTTAAQIRERRQPVYDVHRYAPSVRCCTAPITYVEASIPNGSERGPVVVPEHLERGEGAEVNWSASCRHLPECHRNDARIRVSRSRHH